MNPKKSKDLIPEVAGEVLLPTRVVEDIVNFYWREVWENLTTLKGPKIHIENLGDFNIKHWLLDKEIKKCESFPEKTRLTGQQKYVSGFKIKDKLVLLEKIKAEVQEEKQRRDFIYEHKKITNETTEQYYPNLEE